VQLAVDDVARSFDRFFVGRAGNIGHAAHLVRRSSLQNVICERQFRQPRQHFDRVPELPEHDVL
jgi:hypothetical protein